MWQSLPACVAKKNARGKQNVRSKGAVLRSEIKETRFVCTRLELHTSARGVLRFVERYTRSQF